MSQTKSDMGSNVDFGTLAAERSRRGGGSLGFNSSSSRRPPKIMTMSGRRGGAAGKRTVDSTSPLSKNPNEDRPTAKETPVTKQRVPTTSKHLDSHPVAVAGTPSSNGPPWVFATVVADNCLPLFDLKDSGDPDPELQRGTATGRVCLLYPMVRDDNGAVYMQHRTVNATTGELTALFAQIQPENGPVKVSEFSLYP